MTGKLGSWTVICRLVLCHSQLKLAGTSRHILFWKEVVDADIAATRQFWTLFNRLLALLALPCGRALLTSTRLFSRFAEEELYLF